MRCFRKLLGISYRDHITNDAVRDRIRQVIGPYDDILTMVKKRKLKWFGLVSRSSGLAKTILQGTLQGGRSMQGPTKEALGKQHRWMDMVEVFPHCKRSWRQNKMEGEGCNVCGAPMVIDYGIGVGAWVLNASYMFQPLMSFCIHTQKRKQLPSIHWKTSFYFSFTQRRTSSWHAYTKEEAVNMVHKTPSGYHADTVNNQLPSSHREKSSCYTHTQAFTNTPERRTNREEQASNIHTEKTISYYICRHIRISSLEITKEQAVTSHT